MPSHSVNASPASPPSVPSSPDRDLLPSTDSQGWVGNSRDRGRENREESQHPQSKADFRSIYSNEELRKCLRSSAPVMQSRSHQHGEVEARGDWNGRRTADGECFPLRGPPSQQCQPLFHSKECLTVDAQAHGDEPEYSLYHSTPVHRARPNVGCDEGNANAGPEARQTANYLYSNEEGWGKGRGRKHSGRQEIRESYQSKVQQYIEMQEGDSAHPLQGMGRHPLPSPYPVMFPGGSSHTAHIDNMIPYGGVPMLFPMSQPVMPPPMLREGGIPEGREVTPQLQLYHQAGPPWRRHSDDWGEPSSICPRDSRKSGGKGERLQSAAPPLHERPPKPSSKKTTVMVRNLPSSLSQKQLTDAFGELGFAFKFDFFYSPINFENGGNKGYCFVNFKEPSVAEGFVDAVTGLALLPRQSAKVCVGEWARIQGLQANVEHFRTSDVNTEEVPFHFRPMIFGVDGQQIPFPTKSRPLTTRSEISRPGFHRQEQAASSACKVMVAGLDPQTGSEALKCLMSQFGKVRHVCIVRDRETKQSKKYGFCEFWEEGAVERALNGCMSPTQLELDGSIVVLKPYKQKVEKFPVWEHQTLK